jgi:hypothetical protein
VLGYDTRAMREEERGRVWEREEWEPGLSEILMCLWRLRRKVRVRQSNDSEYGFGT